jgi:precorrin-2 methylase/predicted 2-oxoglutarate/Fe(II)-dependent dioxygenase YbiX
MKSITVPHIAESFLSQDECLSLIRVIQRYANPASKLKTVTKKPSRTLIAARTLPVDGFEEEAHSLAKIIARCQAEIEREFAPEKPIFPGFTVLQGNYRGDAHSRHADSRKFNEETSTWEPNHTPNWLYTCGVYLNEGGDADFAGGELVFPTLGQTVTARPGLLVTYPSDERFEHEVPAITSGSRYSLLIWFTDNPEAKQQDWHTEPMNFEGEIGADETLSAAEPAEVPIDPKQVGQLVIVGSGIAAISHFTLETIGYIREADVVFYHANSGVTAAYIRELNSNAVDLYQYYGDGKVRTITYVQMAELMLREVRAGRSVVGLFHGHPGFFVMAARRSLAIAKMEGHTTALIPAVSAIDCLFADLRIDPGVSGMQILKASHVLREGAQVATDNHLVLIQIGSVGDNTFSFSGFKQAKYTEFFEKLISIYGENHDSVYYVAPIFPGCDPLITVRKLHEYRHTATLSTVHAATLYLPPAGVSHASLTRRQAFKGREPYGEFEIEAVAALASHEMPEGYKLRGSSPEMLRAVTELGSQPAAVKMLRDAPEEFLARYHDLNKFEREALASLDTARLRAVTTQTLGDEKTT